MLALYSVAGEGALSRISRMQSAAAPTVSPTPAWANTSVFPPMSFSPSGPDSSQAISRTVAGPAAGAGPEGGPTPRSSVRAPQKNAESPSTGTSTIQVSSARPVHPISRAGVRIGRMTGSASGERPPGGRGG
nr:hypothetical protein GCM10020093_002020 [Planobispora longispora]